MATNCAVSPLLCLQLIRQHRNTKIKLKGEYQFENNDATIPRQAIIFSLVRNEAIFPCHD